MNNFEMHDWVITKDRGLAIVIGALSSCWVEIFYLDMLETDSEHDSELTKVHPQSSNLEELFLMDDGDSIERWRDNQDD